jgi:hypothetical protein
MDWHSREPLSLVPACQRTLAIPGSDFTRICRGSTLELSRVLICTLIVIALAALCEADGSQVIYWI